MEENLREKQQLFIEKALAGDNIYLSGKAGTGKTFVVKKYLEIMEKEGKNIVRLAPTGIAAYNIGGQTIHSFFKIPIKDPLTFKTIRMPAEDKIELYSKVDIFVIDEVSMLRPDVLNAIFLTMKKGGVPNYLDKQYIFIGDLMQLEAVIMPDEVKGLKRRFGGLKFFDATEYDYLDVEEIELDEIVRQSDPEFIEHLNILRDGDGSPYFRQFIREEVRGVVLAPHNQVVDRYNREGLKDHPGKIVRYENSVVGKATLKDFDLPEFVEVKEGCKIMCTINKPESNIFNGTMGTYTTTKTTVWRNYAGKVEPKEILCGGIRLEDGSVFPLPPVKYDKVEYVVGGEGLKKEVVGSATGHPFKLAYALTIHKSQGLTFDELTIDLSKKCFADGQLYTAFSRVRSPEGLNIVM